jgi:hypothetical protein
MKNKLRFILLSIFLNKSNFIFSNVFVYVNELIPLMCAYQCFFYVCPIVVALLIIDSPHALWWVRSGR